MSALDLDSDGMVSVAEFQAFVGFQPERPRATVIARLLKLEIDGRSSASHVVLRVACAGSKRGMGGADAESEPQLLRRGRAEWPGGITLTVPAPGHDAGLEFSVIDSAKTGVKSSARPIGVHTMAAHRVLGLDTPAEQSFVLKDGRGKRIGALHLELSVRRDDTISGGGECGVTPAVQGIKSEIQRALFEGGAKTVVEAMQLLRDRVCEFDVDGNGELDTEELQEILEALMGTRVSRKVRDDGKGGGAGRGGKWARI